MREWRADVAHMHTLGSHVLGVRAAMRAKVRTLRTEHHYAHYRDPSASAFTRWALRRTESVVAISTFVRRELLSEAPDVAPRLRVVRNGVDADAFSFASGPAEPKGPVGFAMACRLEAWKGVDLAIAALREVPNATLTVAGEGSQRASLEALAAKHGLRERVTFLGRSEDVAAVFAAAECTINASEKEPLGLSVLESLAVGRPVVAFAEGGIPEIVTDGETGFLAAPRSVSALASAMRRAVDARGALPAMGAGGRAFVERECTVARMCAGYKLAYAELTA
jgi:glycosyltransferase involved in cell wall biosynthesis